MFGPVFARGVDFHRFAAALEFPLSRSQKFYAGILIV